MRKRIVWVILIVLLFCMIYETNSHTDNSKYKKDTVLVDEEYKIPDTLPWSQRMAETILISYPNIYEMKGNKTMTPKLQVLL